MALREQLRDRCGLPVRGSVNAGGADYPLLHVERFGAGNLAAGVGGVQLQNARGVILQLHGPKGGVEGN